MQFNKKLDDAGLCELFGTTLKEVEADVERYERGDFSGIAFSEPVEGLKRACGEAVVEETTAMCKLDNGCVLMDDGVEARAKEWEDGSREGSLANVRFGRHQLADGPLIGRRYSRSREVSMEELCVGWDGVKVGEEWGGPDVGAEIC